MIDLRSDTVTQPTAAMREAMADAPVGDDVYGEDLTVNALQARCAALTGKEAALFVPTGTMANQVSLAALTRPGDEVIASQGAHCFLYEGGAGAVLSGLQFQAVGSPDGLFAAADVRKAFKPDTHHYSPTTVVAFENTHNRGGGTLWPSAQLEEAARGARDLGMRTHLDGARIFNAHVATGTPIRDFARPFDTVTFCFSKGLGAPVGSIVCASAALIDRAHRYRKMFGGAMRQSGILAAAAIYALDHHVARLADDHTSARAFASVIAECKSFRIKVESVQTNIVWFDVVAGKDATTLAALCKERGILVNALEGRLRVVTHLNVSSAECEHAARVLCEIASQ